MALWQAVLLSGILQDTAATAVALGSIFMERRRIQGDLERRVRERTSALELESEARKVTLSRLQERDAQLAEARHIARIG